MLCDYWLYWNHDESNEVFVTLDLMIRPLKGESVYFAKDGVEYQAEITKIIHVAESDYDDPRIELHADLIEETSKEEEEDTDTYTRCAQCHSTELEDVCGENLPDTLMKVAQAVERRKQKRLGSTGMVEM